MDKKTIPPYTTKQNSPISKEGVVYTPSHDNIPETDTKVSSKPRKQAVKAKSSSAAIILIITTVFGVLTSIVAFAILFNTFFGGNTVNNTANHSPALINIAQPPPPVIEPVVTEVGQLGVAVIRDIDTLARTLTIYHIDNNTVYTLPVSIGAPINNRFGETLVFGELRIGDIVDIQMDMSSDNLTAVSINGTAIEFTEVSNVQVDTANGFLTVGNNHYFFSDETISVLGGQPHSVENISPMDIVTIRVYQNKVYYISVSRSHGFLEVINADHIIDGSIEVRSNIVYLNDEDFSPIKLPEGSNTVIVRGSNTETLSINVLIQRGEYYQLDLSHVEQLSGILNVTVNVDGATITVNGNVETFQEPLNLIHGEYTISVTMEGFEPYERTIQLNQSVLTLNIQLVEIPVEPEIAEEVIDELIDELVDELVDELLDEMIVAEIEIPELIPTRPMQITTDPSNAEVFIDNLFVGITPLTIEIPIGERTIRFRKEGHLETTHVEQVEARSRSALFFILQSDDLFIPSP